MVHARTGHAMVSYNGDDACLEYNTWSIYADTLLILGGASDGVTLWSIERYSVDGEDNGALDVCMPAHDAAFVAWTPH